MSDVPRPGSLNYASPPKPGLNLRQVAFQQRVLNLCILGYIVAVVLSFAIPPGLLKVIPAILVLAAGITGAVFVFMLALSLYGVALGIVLGILTLVPLIGLLVLLIINSRATRVLRDAGVHVGLLGANPNDVPVA